MTEDAAMALVAALVAAFPDAVVGAETLAIYARCLRDLDDDTAAAAVASWITRERRFPAIADLRSAADAVRGTAPPDADLAYAEVLRAVRAGRQPARWSHPAIKAAVDAVGFREIGQSTTPGVERAHFAKAYDAAARRTRDADAAQLVSGLLPAMRELMAAPSRASQGRVAAPAPQRSLPAPAKVGRK